MIPTYVPTYYTNPQAVVPQPALQPAQSESERLAAIKAYFEKRYLSDPIPVNRLEGGDIPDFVSGEHVEFLLAEPRYSRLIDAITRALEDREHVKNHSLEAHIVFQQDLWNRFDALHRLASSATDDVRKAQASDLAMLIARLMAHVAPSREALQGLPSNFEAASSAYPQLDPKLFDEASPWRELIATSKFDRTTTHASTAGYRKVFRVFLKIPDDLGGPECLESAFRDNAAGRAESPCVQWRTTLGYDAKAMLLETLLALASDGTIVPVPLIVLVQAREIRRLSPGADGLFDLEDLPFDILYGSRRAIASASRAGGGLTLMASDDPVPQNVSAFRRARQSAIVPARVSCRVCHGLDGRTLMTTSSHGLTEVLVLHPKNIVEQERVIRAKLASPDYAVLKQFFMRE